MTSVFLLLQFLQIGRLTIYDFMATSLPLFTYQILLYNGWKILMQGNKG